MSTTETPTRVEKTKRQWTTVRVLDRVVQVIGFAWVCVALFYYTSAPEVDPSLIKTWIGVQFVLAIISIVLSVKARR